MVVVVVVFNNLHQFCWEWVHGAPHAICKNSVFPPASSLAHQKPVLALSFLRDNLLVMTNILFPSFWGTGDSQSLNTLNYTMPHG